MKKKIISVLLALAMFVPMAIAQPGMGGNTQRKISVTYDITYREGDSNSWKLDLAEPEMRPGGPLRPAIVIIHGGGWSMGSKNDPVYRELMMGYAQQGYVALSVGYRLTQEAPFPACIQDVKCAVRWLKAHAKEYNVDPDKIGVYGHSAGAHLALMLGVSSDNKELEDGPWQEYSSSVTCVAAGSPPTEIGNPASPWSKHPEWWPIGYFDAKTVSPMLLLQGIDDAVVKVNLTDDFVAKMVKAGADVEYVRIHGHHGVAFDLHLNVTKPAMDNFFSRNLRTPVRR